MTEMRDALAERARALAVNREPFVRATVVRAQHPTSARAGDTGLLLADGTLEGFVGGACVEASVREYGLKSLAAHEPLLLRVVAGEPSQVREEGAVQVSNPCLSGGAVEIFLEPSVPAPRVLVIGTTPVAQALVALGRPLGLEMHRTVGADALPRTDDAALIVASHGRDEEPVLEAALNAEVPYIALVASQARGAAVLASLNVTEEQRALVHSPAGLQLGARSPAEIALSILAQLVAERAKWPAAQAPSPDTVPVVVDPVCGMSVTLGDSTPRAPHDGETVYFCSESCRRSFLADPVRYVVAT
ncbi:YHS domain-containing protein [Cryobacterium sinapicolor]|uniref:YHS domain-containing protein n=1 Tax=Cryobacterium sinapicolor TaxID=1259236 RepID=A0ABY2J4Z6_9MICO|nr:MULTISPECIES: XdhC family protein [Cryobacterium]TFC88858.1 YHS domain-containing protein [Cryobacterium sp. TMT3-29-2]TFD00012.1 YHS domain-containing protein [Cryobacterium sinapicolor]